MDALGARQQARRNDVIEATCRVILRDGLGGASMRAIAKELGTTVGVITHHFDTKDELIQLAVQHVTSGLFDEAVARTAPLPPPERLQQLMEAALPTTPTRRRHWQVWISFLGTVLSSPELLEDERDQQGRYLKALQRTLEKLRDDGWLAAGVDPRREARVAMSVVDGLGLDATLNPRQYPAGLQRQAVRRYCAQLSARG